jgi:hypothetical protein
LSRGESRREAKKQRSKEAKKQRSKEAKKQRSKEAKKQRSKEAKKQRSRSHPNRGTCDFNLKFEILDLKYEAALSADSN